MKYIRAVNLYMLSKVKIKWIRSLKIKKYREHSQCFIVEGKKNIQDFINAKHTPLDLILLENNEIDEIPIGTNIFKCTLEQYKEISTMDTPPGFLAIFQFPKQAKRDRNKNILLLDNIKDPGNMGTIIRTADWFGIDEIFCSYDCVDAFNPKVVAASMGSLSRVFIHQTDLVSFIQENNHYQYYALDLKGEDYSKSIFTSPMAIITGSESHGISSEILELNIHKIKINGSSDRAESLNAAIATSIVLAKIYSL